VEILQVVLQVLLGLTSLLLTLLILLHKGRGGGLSDMFGGGVTSSLGASGVAERNLNRITVILGLVWITCIVVLGLITKFTPDSDGGHAMASGNSAIRGSRVGAGPMGEQDRGFHADRVAVSYWDAQGNETVRYFAANLPEEEIPDIIDSPSTGLPAGRDKDNPPSVSKLEPYKTHLAYVKERRTDEEAAALLEEALTQLRTRRGQITPQD